MTGEPPIVVTGGSVTIDFDEQTFPKQNGKHSNSNKKIKSVEVTDANGQSLFSYTVPNGKITITIEVGS
ncbi:MAG TPA: hypothetical protein VGV59_03135 [Pyrinomonadaceae bacterium]|nr:hypothetical protein [Pyrinomonadaceae bacterium]